MSLSRLPRLIMISDRVYRRLLFLYPTRFRREFGAEMAQTFRACCLAAIGRRGPSALVSLWGLTLWDLVLSALAERARGGGIMSRAVVVRIGGAAAMIAGLLPFALVPAALFLTTNIVWLIAPGIVLFFVLSLVGFQAHQEAYAERMGWLHWLGRLGVLITLAGFLMAASGFAVAQVIAYRHYLAGAPDPADTAIQAFFQEMYWRGFGVLGAGLVLCGFGTLRAASLGRRSRLPLLLGLLALALYPLIDEALSATRFVRTNSTGDMLIMLLAIALDLGWVLLGVALWSSAGPASPARGSSTGMEARATRRSPRAATSTDLRAGSGTPSLYSLLRPSQDSPRRRMGGV